jgi:3',5'-cyclic AMP phosphodiesterase CpdA
VIRFGVLSDPHITVPETLQDYPGRSHFLEVSIPAIDKALEALQSEDIDFLMIPGDLTQNGEKTNHAWLVDRLNSLPYPTYLIPGNHDAPAWESHHEWSGLKHFPNIYKNFGYKKNQLYYAAEVAPNIHLIGLNSNQFIHGRRYVVGAIDDEQYRWLETTLKKLNNDLVMVMVHHNILEHIPLQARHPMTKSYIIEKHERLVHLLSAYGVELVFTGHFHMQDIAEYKRLYDITTGSLVGYPHPYRICEIDEQKIKIKSYQVTSLEQWPDLHKVSLERMKSVSDAYMIKLLTSPPLSIPLEKAKQFAPQLRFFWPKIVSGNAHFSLPDFPLPIQMFFAQFNDHPPDDNNVILPLHNPIKSALS